MKPLGNLVKRVNHEIAWHFVSQRSQKSRGGSCSYNQLFLGGRVVEAR